VSVKARKRFRFGRAQTLLVDRAAEKVDGGREAGRVTTNRGESSGAISGSMPGGASSEGWCGGKKGSE